MRNQFTFYRSYFEAVIDLPKKDQTAVILAICDYALNEAEPNLAGTSKAVFNLIRPILDAARRKAEGGKKGTPTKDNEKIPQRCPKDTEKEKEGEKEKEKEKEGERENECYIMAQTVVCLPLNDGTEFPVTEDMVQEFSSLYPAVDVEQALRSMRGWLLGNPKNRKTSSGIRRFINSWLSRDQDRARPQQKQAPVSTTDRMAAMIERGDFDD